MNDEKKKCISIDDLEEFKQFAQQSEGELFNKLINKAPVLTTRSYLDMCRVIYDAVFDKEYISNLSTAELFCKARLFGYEHERIYGILGGDWDSPKDFKISFMCSYHNEEVIFGGPHLYIEEINLGWYGLICENGKDTEHLITAVKMFNALRKNKYPIRFYEYEKVYYELLKRLDLQNTEI